MKTLKLTLAAIALLFVGIAANAAVKPASDKITKADVVNIYIDAIANGKSQELDKILDNEMQFNMKRGDKVNTMSKSTLLDYLNKSGASTPPVNTNTVVMQDDDTSEKVKISFNYDGFVRTDVVTLNHSFGWKITNVTSSYK